MAQVAAFQAQVAAVMETLANAAVAEICRLVEEGYTALRSQAAQERHRSDAEKEALRRQLRDTEAKLRSCERRLRGRGGGVLPHCTGTGGPDDGPLPAVSEEKSLLHKDDVLPLVKQEKVERDDCNLNLKVELNIRAECGFSTESGEEESRTDLVLDTSITNFPPSTSQRSPSPRPPSLSDATVDLTCRPRSKRKAWKPAACGGLLGSVGGASELPGSVADSAVKTELQMAESTEEELPSSQLETPMASAEPSPERLNSLDLAWMQERVGHLGAAYAVAQMGLGNSDGGQASASFPSQGGDGLDTPPTMLFSGNHDMTAFAASFDLAAVAPLPTAAAAASTTAAATPGSRRTPRSGSTAIKEAAVCTVCGRLFPSAAALELHQRVHTGERPYTCPQCGKGFAQPNNLRVHLLIHTGERRYRCTLCGKSFISSSHLKRHRTVHTQEKPYSCARCGQAFSQMCSVRRHRQQSQCGL